MPFSSSAVARPAQRRAVLALVIGTILASPAFAQTTGTTAAGEGAPDAIASAAAASGAATTLDALTVTGARVSGRTVENSPSPIDVISATEIATTNKVDVLDVLNATVPSWNTPIRGGTSGHGSMVRAGQLRGLSPNHTLVLVNGKRWHPTALLTAGGLTGQAPVDLGLIPNGVIERIEVLRDGASAIYGSDAIAGVVNIITDKSAEGGEASFRAGQYFKGDGMTKVGVASAGFGWGERGHVRLTGQFSDADPTVTTTPVPPEYLFYFPRGANGNAVLPVTATGAPHATNGYLLPRGATPDPREATRDSNVQKISGNRETELRTLSLDAGHELGESADFYAFLNYSQRSSQAPQNYRPAYRDETVRAIFPDGYAPKDELDEKDFGTIVGIRGLTASGWSWDLSSVYGEDRMRWYMHNDLNPTCGMASQTSFYIGQLRHTAWTNNFDLQRSFDVGSWPNHCSSPQGSSIVIRPTSAATATCSPIPTVASRSSTDPTRGGRCLPAPATASRSPAITRATTSTLRATAMRAT